MGRLSRWTLLFILTFSLLPAYSPSQELTGKRKLVDRVAPAYPTLARSNRLYGVVKVEVWVAPDGSVKSAGLRGGHPVLAQAALDAVRKWKWEAGARESREVVEVNFTP